MVAGLCLERLFVQFLLFLPIEITLSALDGASLHLDRSVRSVQPIVKPTGVADGVSRIISSP